jgi:oxygen-independent coproporphyrinogen-3 oxidase
MKELDTDTAASLYERTQARMNAAGLPAYEVSNHAKPGEGSRHNLIYWRYGDYLGVGPGAHGRLTIGGEKFATATERQPEAWLTGVAARGHGLERWERVAAHEQGTEALLMGLRLTEGVEPARIERLLGRTIPEARVAALESQGFITRSTNRLRTTPKGRLVLNAVLKQLVA